MDKRVYSRIPKKSGKLTQKKAITTTEELDKAQIKKVFIPSNALIFQVVLYDIET